LGGPISIGSIFPDEWNWQYFWRITALLSVILAIMNVLPIPALDGGHALFILVELITGRKPSDKVLMVAQAIGMSLLILLMLYATFNDIARLF
jgi:regulator of sigma E protease